MNQREAVERFHLISEVIPFLPADLAAHYGTPEAWRNMSGLVGRNLAAALPPSSP